MTRTRTTSRRLDDLHSQTSDRDSAMLASLDSHRYLTTSQLARLHFAREPEGRIAIRGCVRVLGRLRHLGVVSRLDRQVGGVRAGSAAYVWSLTVTGERLLRRGTDAPYRRTQHLPSLDHLAHVLAVAEVHLLLIELSRSGRLELVGAELEPACWRRFVGPDSAPQILKPDLAAVTADADFETAWLVEVDRGREGMAVLLKKCAQYTSYYRTGREQAANGVFPYVLWLLPSVERAERLEREIECAHGIESELFRFSTPSSLLATLTGTSPAEPTTTNTSLVRLLAGGAHERF